MYILVYTSEGLQMTTTAAATLTIQKWGNSLAVRIPAKIARNAHVHSGTPVELAVHKGEIIVKPTGEAKLTLAERLERFDPKKHSGELMSSDLIGVEKF
jgi:antitoxin MazE